MGTGGPTTREERWSADLHRPSLAAAGTQDRHPPHTVRLSAVRGEEAEVRAPETTSAIIADATRGGRFVGVVGAW